MLSTLLALLGLAGAACATQATLSPAGDALEVSYELCAATRSFAFEAEQAPQRADGWTPQGEGWRFDGEVLSRQDGAPFSRFTLRLAPDARFWDRSYVAIDRVGTEGWTALLYPLRPSEGELVVRFNGFGDDAVLRGAGLNTAANGAQLRVEADEDEPRFVYVGPTANITEGPITVIAGEDVPEWLRRRVLADFNPMIATLTRRFGRPPLVAPILSITHRPEGANLSWKGGVLDGAVVEIRLRGTALSEGDTGLTQDLTALVAHETLHFWNGGSTQNEEQAWLHEGSAEYLADRLWRDAAAMRQRAAQHLNACLLRDDVKPLDGRDGPVGGRAPYDCGYVLSLAAETSSLRRRHGDGFELWRTVFDSAADGRYAPHTFLIEATARGGRDFSDFAQSWLTGAPDRRGRSLTQQLAALGVIVRERPPGPAEAFNVRARAVAPVLASLCNGGWGFTAESDRLHLETGDRCGDALAGDPDIVAVNGVDIINNPAGAHATIRDACARGGALVFQTLAGASLAPVRCSADIEALPTLYEVVSLPRLPRP